FVKGVLPGEAKVTVSAGGWDGRTDNPGVVPAADPVLRSASEITFGNDAVASTVDRQADTRFYGDGRVEAAAGSHRLSARAYGERNRTDARYGSWLGLNEITADATQRLIGGAELQDTLATGWPGAVEVTAGGGWRQEHVVADEQTEDRGGTELSALPRAHVWMSTWSGFVESAARPWGPLTAAVGGRLDHHSYFGNVANPHAGLALAAGPAVFRMSAGTTFAAPTAGDLAPRYGGNPDLKPERGKTVEGGVEAKVGPFGARLGGYGRWVTDQIEWAPDLMGAWAPRNVTKVATRGLEGGVSASRGWFRADANVTTIASFEQVPDGLGGLLPARRAAHVPTWSGGALVGVDLPTGTGVSLAARGAGTRRMYTFDALFQPATKRLAPYGVLTLRLSQKLAEGVEFYGGVENLADTRYATHFGNTLYDGDYPAPGRNLFGGASIRW
ncbi:MAG: TonB-dependent receptor, partial [bacterium]